MSTIFVLIFLASLLSLPVALIKPSIFAFLFRGVASRKKAGLLLGGVALASAIATGIAAPPSNNSQPGSSIKATQTQESQNYTSPSAVAGSSTPSAKPATQSDAPTVTTTPPQTPKPPAPAPAPAPAPQPKTYVNSSGNTVQSPTNYPSVPAGATAKCNDGTYRDRKSTRLNSSHSQISYAVFCL